MNSFSWLLYSINVIHSIDFLLTLFSCLLFIGMSFWSIWTVIEEEDKRNHLWWIGVVLFGVFVAFIPSKNTMYAIAASEMGEKVIMSPIGQKAQKAVLNWIDSQIKETKEDK